MVRNLSTAHSQSGTVSEAERQKDLVRWAYKLKKKL
jgi:hypothetical protein